MSEKPRDRPIGHFDCTKYSNMNKTFQPFLCYVSFRKLAGLEPISETLEATRMKMVRHKPDRKTLLLPKVITFFDRLERIFGRTFDRKISQFREST